MWRLDIRVLYVLRVLKLIPAQTRGTAAIMSVPNSTGIKNNTRINERH